MKLKSSEHATEKQDLLATKKSLKSLTTRWEKIPLRYAASTQTRDVTRYDKDKIKRQRVNEMLQQKNPEPSKCRGEYIVGIYRRK